MEQKYKRTVELDPNAEVHYVSLGPKPGVPKWHALSKPTRHALPTLRAATALAKAHKQIDPTRHVTIDYPDGRRWDGRQWIT